MVAPEEQRPSARQIFEGKDANGNPTSLKNEPGGYINSGFSGVLVAKNLSISDGNGKFNFEDFVFGKKYRVHIVMRRCEILSEPVFSKPFRIGDPLGFVDPAPSVSNITITGVTFNYQASQAGIVYWVVYPAATAAPSFADLKTPTATAIVSGNANTDGTVATATITGLTAGTAYKLYMPSRQVAQIQM